MHITTVREQKHTHTINVHCHIAVYYLRGARIHSVCKMCFRDHTIERERAFILMYQF